MKTLAEMRARAGELAEEIEALLAKDELSDEESTRCGDLETEADALHAEIAETEAREERLTKLRTAAAKKENVEPGEAPNANVRTEDPYDLSTMRTSLLTDGPRKVAQELRGRALKAIETSDAEDEGKERATYLVSRKDDAKGTIAKIILGTGGEDYRSAWSKLMTQERPHLTPEENAAVERAMSLTDSAGGYAVPFTLDPSIVLTNDGAVNPFRAISRVETITTDSWNGVSSAGVSASWDAEAAEVSDDAPTLAQPTVPVYKGAAFVPFSIEIGQDFANLATETANLIRDAKDRLEATAFATGAGSTEPTGIVTAPAGTASEINVGTTETFAVADVYTVEEALGPRFRPRASFVANKAIYNKVRQFDTGGGASLWVRLDASRPSELIGYPAYEASAMDGTWDTTATANNYILVLGDFSNYLIADRVGLSIEFIPHLFHTSNNRPSGSRGWYAYWRTGADSINDAAFTLLDLPTTA